MATWVKKSVNSVTVYDTNVGPSNGYSNARLVNYQIIEMNKSEYVLWIRWSDSGTGFRVGVYKTLEQAKKHATIQYGISPR